MSSWLIIVGLIAVAVAALFVARARHQERLRERRSPRRHGLQPLSNFKTVFPDADPLDEERAQAIVEAEVRHASPAAMTPNEVAAEAMAPEAGLPVEALPAFGDHVIVARMAGPQLLMESARQVLSLEAEDTDGPDLPDPLVRALDGGGAAMVMPAGASVETALHVLDLLSQPSYGEPVYGEAWVTIRQDDVFLLVNDAEADTALRHAHEATTARLDEGDPRFGESLTAAVSSRLVDRGLPYGTQLYAFYAEDASGPEPYISLTSRDNEGYVAQWETLDLPRLHADDRVRRAFQGIPEDVAEVMGL